VDRVGGGGWGGLLGASGRGVRGGEAWFAGLACRANHGGGSGGPHRVDGGVDEVGDDRGDVVGSAAAAGEFDEAGRRVCGGGSAGEGFVDCFFAHHTRQAVGAEEVAVAG